MILQWYGCLVGEDCLGTGRLGKTVEMQKPFHPCPPCEHQLMTHVDCLNCKYRDGNFCTLHKRPLKVVSVGKNRDAREACLDFDPIDVYATGVALETSAEGF